MASYCTHCGTKFAPDQDWLKTCASCGITSYDNPKPVAVVIIPILGQGILTVRRGIEPHYGKLALPGGFMEKHETWQQACVRELREETGMGLFEGDIVLESAASTPHGQLLLFASGPAFHPRSLDGFKPNPEVLELVVVGPDAELAFPLHTEAMRQFFSKIADAE